jgi:hypothetical protein
LPQCKSAPITCGFPLSLPGDGNENSHLAQVQKLWSYLTDGLTPTLLIR